MKNFFYYHNEHADYIGLNGVLIHKRDSGDKIIHRISDVDNPRGRKGDICYLVEYQHYVVMLLDWCIHRNVLCFDKNTDELIWQLDVPKDVFKTRKNCWVRIYELQDDPGEVMVNSIDGYRAAFDIATGKKTWEHDKKSGDPRDF